MGDIPHLNELLVAHTCLQAMAVHLDVDGMVYDLSLSVSASESADADVVSVVFCDVSHLASHGLGGGLTQLMHLNVKKLDSGFDRMRYQLSDLEDGKLSFCFSSFLIV